MSFVLFLFYLTTCVCVCHQVHGPLRECLRARRFRASLLLHTTCVRSCCKWRASRVVAKHSKKNSPRRLSDSASDSWCNRTASCVAASHTQQKSEKRNVHSSSIHSQQPGGESERKKYQLQCVLNSLGPWGLAAWRFYTQTNKNKTKQTCPFRECLRAARELIGHPITASLVCILRFSEGLAMLQLTQSSNSCRFDVSMFDFLPESNQQSWDWQSRAPTN